jgi:hypothetical protein
MKLLGVTRRTQEYIVGYVEMGEEYRKFVLHLDTGEVDTEFRPPFEKTMFKSYKHFAGAIGKYDMFAILTDDPIEIKEITEAEIDRVIKDRPDLTTGLQFSHW